MYVVIEAVYSMDGDNAPLQEIASLCEKHHMDAEKFHITEGKEWVKDMHPNDLYKIIYL